MEKTPTKNEYYFWSTPRFHNGHDSGFSSSQKPENSKGEIKHPTFCIPLSSIKKSPARAAFLLHSVTPPKSPFTNGSINDPRIEDSNIKKQLFSAEDSGHESLSEVSINLHNQDSFETGLATPCNEKPTNFLAELLEKRKGMRPLYLQLQEDVLTELSVKKHNQDSFETGLVTPCNEKPTNFLAELIEKREGMLPSYLQLQADVLNKLRLLRHRRQEDSLTALKRKREKVQVDLQCKRIYWSEEERAERRRVATYQRHQVDFFTELKKMNCEGIILNILDYLPAEDLCRLYCTSKMYKELILEDKVTDRRRNEYLEYLKEIKENRLGCRISPLDMKKRYECPPINPKIVLDDITNCVNKPKIAPLCFDSRIDLFIEEGKKIGGPLLMCPSCRYVARKKLNDEYICLKCSHVFCKKCLSPISDYHKCQMLSMDRTECEIPTLIVGSKQCKRNLRRL